MEKLPKRRILRRKGEFQRVYRLGKTFANHYLVLYVFRCDGDEKRVGFAAGKKLGNAVTRNRIKRLLRESYRLHQDQLKEGYSLLLVGRKAMVPVKYKTAEMAFLGLAKRAGILKGNTTTARKNGPSGHKHKNVKKDD